MNAPTLVQHYVLSHNAGDFARVRALFADGAAIHLIGAGGAADRGHTMARFRRSSIELLTVQPMTDATCVARYVHPETCAGGTLVLSAADGAITSLAVAPSDAIVSPSALYPTDAEAPQKYGAYAGAVLGNLDRRKALWPITSRGMS